MAQGTKIGRIAKEIQADIDFNKARLQQLQILGDKGCCAYDLSMGYNADYYLNVSKIHSWRIELYRRELEAFNANNIELVIFG